MGLIRMLMRKYPRLRDKELRVKIILDLIFYALFFCLIFAANPIYVDYCSKDLGLNVSDLKNLTPFNESMFINLNSSVTFNKTLNASNLTIIPEVNPNASSGLINTMR